MLSPDADTSLSQDFSMEDYQLDLKMFNEDSWFQTIDSASTSPDQLQLSPSSCGDFSFTPKQVHSGKRPARFTSRQSLSPCSDSNMSSISTTSCMYEQQQHNRAVTPSSGLSSNITGPFSGIGTAAQSVPSNIPYQGQYGFQLAFDAQPKDTKSISWTYSQALRKLFVRMASSCPIKFRTAYPAPAGSVIRASPTYMKPEHVKDIVYRCPNHTTAKEFNDNHPAPSHLLRCEHVMAKYCEDPLSHRKSVTIPAEQPQAGSEWVTNLYQFMCFSSCAGGLNRRPLQVIFTLEHEGHVLGRQSIEVRICACPGRDRKGEENSIFPTPKPVKRAHGTSSSKIGSAAKRVNFNGQNTEEFTLVIRGKENFEILSKIRDSLELAFFLSKESLGVMEGGQTNITNTKQ